MDTRPRSESSAAALGDRLIALGIITEEQLRQAHEVQRRSQGFLGQILVDLGYVASSDIGTLIA